MLKQSPHDQTALVPQNHSIVFEDNGDGSYHIVVTLLFACIVKLFVNLDKNLPGGAGELPPLTLAFVKGEGRAQAQQPNGLEVLPVGAELSSGGAPSADGASVSKTPSMPALGSKERPASNGLEQAPTVAASLCEPAVDYAQEPLLGTQAAMEAVTEANMDTVAAEIADVAAARSSGIAPRKGPSKRAPGSNSPRSSKGGTSGGLASFRPPSGSAAAAKAVAGIPGSRPSSRPGSRPNSARGAASKNK